MDADEVALTWKTSWEKRVLNELGTIIGPGETFRVSAERAEYLLATYPGWIVEAAPAPRGTGKDKTPSTPHSPEGTADPAKNGA